jgi:molybdopterin-guanine dinucleotide biosynthesis protein A
MSFGAVVLAGGAARRLGGAPKPVLSVAGVPLLTRVLDAVADAAARIVVGPRPEPGPDGGLVRFTREDPAGAGPVAAIAAGLAQLDPALDLVAVLGADLPFLTSDAVDRLRRAIDPDTDLAVYVDSDGRPQWMCGVWRRAALDRRLAELGDPAGVGVRRLAEGLRRVELTDARHRPAPDEPGTGGPDGPPVWFDCDTEDDLRRAEEWARGR